jgi:hypothetical protein
MSKSRRALIEEADDLLGSRGLRFDERREYLSPGYVPSFGKNEYEQPNWWRGDTACECCGRPRAYGAAARCRKCYRDEARAKYRYKLGALADIGPQSHARIWNDADERETVAMEG